MAWYNRIYRNNTKAFKRLKMERNMMSGSLGTQSATVKSDLEYMYACVQSISGQREIELALEDKSAFSLFREVQCSKPKAGVPWVQGHI
jgi:hypothetical protein